MSMHSWLARGIAWLGCAAALAAGGAVAGCSITIPGWSQPAFEEVRQIAAPVGDAAPVAIESNNGAISVREGPEGNQITVTATIRAMSEERMALTEVRADRQVDGSLLVWVEWPEERQPSEGARLEVEVPAGRASSLKARSSNGAILLTGLSCPGGADLKSSNGAITVRGFTGDVLARTSNGAVTVEGATGDVEAHSSNGRIEVIQAPGAGSVVTHTSNGRVRIELASGFAGEISGQTSNGRLTLPTGDDVTLIRLDRRDAAVRIGPADAEGAARVEVKTSNGAVEVRR
jgi:hypothetical protein